MLIKRTKGWELDERQATPESVFHNRREILRGLGMGSIGAGAAALGALTGIAPTLIATAAVADTASDPSASLYPMKQNPKYKLDRPLTKEEIAVKYNNYYEFGSQKQIWREAQALKVRPWTVTIDGMVEKPMTIAIDDLLKAMPLEERLYRHRCVEAWSMAVPWSGFALSALVAHAKPLGSAKYVTMKTFLDAKMAPGQRQSWYPWPYTEGLTMAEATNDLAFMVTGVYGKPLPPQSGSPLRLAVPWKYGFKSVKSIVSFTFTDKRPKTFWEEIQSSEYGFWANVNPKVPHPRWSQATEEVIGTGERVPTQLFNGYGEFVADIYTNLQGERLYV